MIETTPTRANVAVLRQMLNLIPLGMINRHARETGIDSKARSFSVLSHLSAMLFAQLSHAMGLNDVCDWLRLKSSMLARSGVTPPARNTLSPENKQRSAQFAEKLFWSVSPTSSTPSPTSPPGAKARACCARSAQRRVAAGIRAYQNIISWDSTAALARGYVNIT
jgi:hypothetical protein